jgi:hypothetical protein
MGVEVSIAVKALDTALLARLDLDLLVILA